MLRGDRNMTPSQLHAALKIAIKRAILVLDSLGDSEMRFQTTGRVWDRAVSDAGMAYGYNEAVVRFVPTAREIAQAEIVADWLAWLGLHHGAGAVPRLVAWSHDDPVWRIAERERCSVRTVHNRIDRSVAAILGEFGDVAIDLPLIDEPPEKAHAAAFTERPVILGDVPIEQHGKVWLDGVGYMLRGTRLRHGHDKIDKVMRAH